EPLPKFCGSLFHFVVSLLADKANLLRGAIANRVNKISPCIQPHAQFFLFALATIYLEQCKGLLYLSGLSPSTH
ncbi:MAG: hypothetical protein AAGA67_11700, partial [Cyanobacteria bacterium P01_F01_bin.153]